MKVNKKEKILLIVNFVLIMVAFLTGSIVTKMNYENATNFYKAQLATCIVQQQDIGIVPIEVNNSEVINYSINDTQYARPTRT